MTLVEPHAVIVVGNDRRLALDAIHCDRDRRLLCRRRLVRPRQFNICIDASFLHRLDVALVHVDRMRDPRACRQVRRIVGDDQIVWRQKRRDRAAKQRILIDLLERAADKPLPEKHLVVIWVIFRRFFCQIVIEKLLLAACLGFPFLVRHASYGDLGGSLCRQHLGTGIRLIPNQRIHKKRVRDGRRPFERKVFFLDFGAQQFNALGRLFAPFVRAVPIVLNLLDELARNCLRLVRRHRLKQIGVVRRRGAPRHHRRDRRKINDAAAVRSFLDGHAVHHVGTADRNFHRRAAHRFRANGCAPLVKDQWISGRCCGSALTRRHS